MNKNSCEKYKIALLEAATLLEAYRGCFAYQREQADPFAPDPSWEKPIIAWLQKYKRELE